ncbi:hypothetical protein BGX38DRAFT_1144473 [Terfezia claveryi]|nr:hypothetical protein BGX38DRAFT_1144473 [Terfezia claveryi]
MIQHLGDGTCELSRSERRRAYAAQQALQSGAPPVKIVCAQAASTMASSSTPSFTPSSDPAPVIKKASVIKKRSIIVLEQLAKARAQLELEALSKSFARLSTSSGISEGGAYEIDTVNKTTGAVGAVGVPVQAAHVVDVPVQAAPMEDTSRLPMTKGGSSRPPTIITEKPTTPNLSSAESDTRISGSPVFAQASSSSKTQKSSYPGPTAKISIILPSVRKPNAANKAMTVKASLKWVARLPPKYEARLFVL